MEEKQTLICDKCRIELKEIEAEFSYLNRTFRNKVMRCPECGQVCLDESLTEGRMREVERMMEDK